MNLIEIIDDSECVILVVPSREDEEQQGIFMTPTQARALAVALMEKADDLDPLDAGKQRD